MTFIYLFIFRGSRYWSYESAQAVSSRLKPLFEKILNNMPSDSLKDWCTSISAATSRTDPNRIRWVFELLLQPRLDFGQGSFKESSAVKLLNQGVQMNWKLQPLLRASYDLIKKHWDHPYQKVRLQISKLLATTTMMDVYYPSEGKKTSGGGAAGEPTWVHCGAGCPTRKEFLNDILPRCKLNAHNPELNGSIASLNGKSGKKSAALDSDPAPEEPNGSQPKLTSTPARRSTRSSGGVNLVLEQTPPPRRRSTRGKVKEKEESMDVSNNEVTSKLHREKIILDKVCVRFFFSLQPTVPRLV